MLLFLAQTAAADGSSAAGHLVVLAVLLGLMAVGVLCVVNAYKYRTTSWIVAGVLGGLYVTVVTLTVVVGLSRGIQKVIDEGGPSGLDDSSDSSRPPATEVIRGREIPYSIRVPVTWTTKIESDDFDTLSFRRSLYVGVIAEEADLGSTETIAEIARKKIADVGTDIRWDDPAPLTLDGRDWLQFTVDCKVEKVPVSYQFYVYSGREGTYQVVGWTTQNLYERDAPQLREVMQTFKFPE